MKLVKLTEETREAMYGVIGDSKGKEAMDKVFWTMAFADNIYGMDLNEFVNYIKNWKVAKGFPRRKYEVDSTRKSL